MEVFSINNYTTDLYEIKREIVNYSKKVSEGLKKPESKFLMDMMYGISKSKSLLISNVSRALDEQIKLINTEARLCDNLSSFSEKEKEIVMKNYYKEVGSLFPEVPICIFDNSDIAKIYGKKFEDLCYVVDGSSKSKNKTVPGYHVCEAVALTKKEKQPISLYSKIYSTESKEFESMNRVTIESLNTVRSVFRRPIIGVFDRGYDAEEFYKEFFGTYDKFIIRMKERHLVFKDKKRLNTEVAKKRKGKIKLTLPFEDGIEVSVSYTRVKLPKYEEELQYIIVYGLSEEEPMMLLTNILENGKESIEKIVRLYMYRWRVEEYFRVKKQEYDFENMRVRTIQSMNILNLMVTLVMGYNGMLAEKLDKKLLCIKIIERSKSFKTKICTWLYQMARGIYNILSFAKTGVKEYQKIEKRKKNIQLSLKL